MSGERRPRLTVPAPKKQPMSVKQREKAVSAVVDIIVFIKHLLKFARSDSGTSPTYVLNHLRYNFICDNFRVFSTISFVICLLAHTKQLAQIRHFQLGIFRA